jgi:threonine/homoserine/homoserine lactone efflux protein
MMPFLFLFAIAFAPAYVPEHGPAIVWAYFSVVLFSFAMTGIWLVLVVIYIAVKAYYAEKQKKMLHATR